MNIFSTVIVTNAKKKEAQKVINDLYYVPAINDEPEYISTRGEGFFDIELKKGTSKYWASSGAFHSKQLTALINSGATYYTLFGNDFQAAVDACGLIKVVISEVDLDVSISPN
jgi:ribosomal protein S16